MPDAVAYILGKYPSKTETFIEQEIRGLREGGMEIQVVALNRVGARECAAAVVRPWAALSAAGSLQRDGCGARRVAGAVLRAAAIAPTLRAAHIHAHFLGLPATVAYCISQMTGIPYSITAHARDIFVETTPEVVVAGAKFRTVCTRTGLRFLHARYPERGFELVRHGVAVTEPVARRSGEDGVVRLLAVGRLVEKKGLDHLVDACGWLHSQGVRFQCRIVGEGPGEADLREKIRTLRLEGRVGIEPFCPHDAMAQHYANSDVLVVPSVVSSNGDRDGVPNVMLEAMACGLPVVATDAGGISEVLIDGLTGVRVPQRDAAAIAGAVLRLRSDTQLRQRLVEGAARYVSSEFDPARWLDKLRRLFEQ